MSTKLNVNVRTLLTSCESLAQDEANYWRLKKYIKSLDTMIAELAEMEAQDTHCNDKISNYLERLQTLKTKTNYTENVQISSNRIVSSRNAASGQEAGDDALRELRQIENSKQHVDLRKDLLQSAGDLRRRQVNGESNGSEDNMNEAVKYYNNAQEKITEHMLSMTRNLKEQTETANRIIRRDTEIVTRSTGMTDKNITSLHRETEKLEQHSRNAYKCWMWLMIVFVIVVFIGMVLFMKIMKKKKA